MLKPIYIDAKIYQYLDAELVRKLELYHRADQFFWTGSDFVAHPRYGASTIWGFDANDQIGSHPDLDQRSDLTFADVSDARALELSRMVEVTGKRLGIFWSGGIDSTAALSAVIKNFPRYLLNQVDIYCNNSSYLENPFFYHRVIHERLSCINIDNIHGQQLEQVFADNLITDGEPADKLWLVEIGLTYQQKHGADSLRQSVQSARDRFCGFLSEYMQPAQADEYMQQLISNIEQTNAPVQNIAELFWWINFNYHWKGHLLGWYIKHKDKSPERWQSYCANYQPWYVTNAFQTWCLSHDSERRLLFDNLAEYKMEAKRYIYELDKNDFYLHYKTKTGSGQRGPSTRRGLVIYSDGSCLDDASQVSAFLEQHCLI